MAILVLILMLLATPAHAVQMIGFGAAGGGACASQTPDVSRTTNNATSYFYSATERGQSWKAGVTGYLYSITLYKNATAPATTFTIRIGTSTTLTSYLVSYTCAISSDAGEKECVIPEASRPSLTSGTTYYMGMRTSNEADETGISIARDSGGGYADGTAYSDTLADWIVATTVSSDLYFVTKMCD